MVKASAGRESMRHQLCTPSAPSLHIHLRTGYFFVGLCVCVCVCLSGQGPCCSIFYLCHMVSLVASRKLFSYSMWDLVPVRAQSLSPVQLFVTLWMVARQTLCP